ncbi:hypothetical protein [Marinobacterium mangrovicola]|uniref:Lipoprotein n=1 Tax=Marinobacterium mangrovicola TaxID=1476959 RepID=A0A4R1GCD8_9GAMM|nr:hypothetical protein [Marinobacterium mangrovicola]TCK05664.1 hypothetical protein CLV83_2592 [Marinobacterium mangrovicola]
MMKHSVMACCMASMLLAGCAGPSYWHEPPAAAAEAGKDNIWQGLVRNGSLHYYARDRLRNLISVNCAGYTDLVSLTQTEDRVEISLGSDPAMEFETGIDTDGRFSLVQPVDGDTWVYGGVMLFDESPELHLWGQLDGVTGLGEGRVNVSPGDERLGCVGYFQVSRNGGAPDEEKRGNAFKIKYWIDEVDSFDNPWFSGMHPRPFPYHWRY